MPESQAQGRVRQIYDDVMHTLGLPYVPVVIQAYAVYPAFLELHWNAFAPVIRTAEFFQLAERVRADAYTRAHSYLAIPDLASHLAQYELSAGAHEELTNLTEFMHFNNALFGVILAAQLQAFEAPIGEPRQTTRLSHAQPAPERPVLIDEETATPRVRDIFVDARRTLGLPFIGSDLRAFARWPDFLAVVWSALKPVSQSAMYESTRAGVRETSYAVAREIPGRIDTTTEQLTDAGLSDDQIGSIARITDAAVEAVSTIMLNVAFVKIGLEGGNSRQMRTRDEQRVA